MLDRFISFVYAAYGTQLVRYLLFSGLAFLIFYVLFRRPLSRFKIQDKFPGWRHYRREIIWSLCSLLIFTLVAWVIYNPWVRPYTQLYKNIGEHGWTWFAVSIGLMIIIHDTWFYWTHRLMHHRRLFKLFHSCHHRSHSPSPWATFAFGPLEAAVQAAVIIVFAFAFPVHPLALLVWLFWMTTFNVLGHLGFEILPAWVYKGVGKYIFNTTTNHDMHHRYSRGNYSIYFRFWDIVMGTTHPRYEEELSQVRERAKRRDWSPNGANQRGVGAAAQTGVSRFGGKNFQHDSSGRIHEKRIHR